MGARSIILYEVYIYIKLHEAHQNGTRFLAMLAVAYHHQWWQWHQWSFALDQWLWILL